MNIHAKQVVDGLDKAEDGFHSLLSHVDDYHIESALCGLLTRLEELSSDVLALLRAEGEYTDD